MSTETLYSHFTDLTHTPRMWGRQSAFTGNIVCTRNTPTHVGKTSPRSSEEQGRGKHPHARGEDDSPVDIGRVPLETPPRTWGRQERVNIRPSSLRNTPTHVGKTGTGGAALLPLQKHPHARGEDGLTVVAPSGRGETPPRTWGRPFSVTRQKRSSGNTPTHVGKTTVLST